MKQDKRALYKGLRALSETMFPKRCAVCGKVYDSMSDFIRETEGLRKSSGLKGTLDDDDRPIVELFRNCTCGSTLLGSFSDRRDTSSIGGKRRDLFGKMLTMLIRKGLEDHVARVELLKFFQGQPSPLLEKMGIKHNG